MPMVVCEYCRFESKADTPQLRWAEVFRHEVKEHREKLEHTYCSGIFKQIIEKYG